MRRGVLIAAVIVLLLAACAAAAPPTDVGPFLQSISVNVKATKGYGGAEGSGTVVLVKRKGADPLTFILTANHVVDGLRETKTVTDDEGQDRKVVRYRDAQVVQETQNEDGTRVVGDTRLDAKVVSVDTERDIALLQVRAVGRFDEGARFYADEKVPSVGTAILHCGCPGGQETSGTGAVTAGIVSRVGVRIPDFGGAEHGIFDHVDCAALGGSSGGMIAKASTGEWIAMLTLGLRGGDSFHWCVPIRSVRAWAEEVGCPWLLDPDATVTEEQIDALVLENHGGAGKAKDEPTPAPKQRFVRMIEESE